MWRHVIKHKNPGGDKQKARSPSQGSEPKKSVLDLTENVVYVEIMKRVHDYSFTSFALFKYQSEGVTISEEATKEA